MSPTPAGGDDAGRLAEAIPESRERIRPRRRRLPSLVARQSFVNSFGTELCAQPNGSSALNAAVQVMTVLPGNEPSYDADHVVVDVMLSGSVRVRGLARTIGASIYLSSPVFPSLSHALPSAHAFAQQHGIACICLVNHTAPAYLSEARKIAPADQRSLAA